MSVLIYFFRSYLIFFFFSSFSHRYFFLIDGENMHEKIIEFINVLLYFRRKNVFQSKIIFSKFGDVNGWEYYFGK